MSRAALDALHADPWAQDPLDLPALNARASQAIEDAIENVRRTQKEKKKTTFGYDVMSGEYVDMVKAGIIDPAKVTRGALANAASIAAMVLTTEALITDLPQKESAPAMPGGGMGGGMGDMDF